MFGVSTSDMIDHFLLNHAVRASWGVSYCEQAVLDRKGHLCPVRPVARWRAFEAMRVQYKNNAPFEPKDAAETLHTLFSWITTKLGARLLPDEQMAFFSSHAKDEEGQTVLAALEATPDWNKARLGLSYSFLFPNNPPLCFVDPSVGDAFQVPLAYMPETLFAFHKWALMQVCSSETSDGDTTFSKMMQTLLVAAYARDGEPKRQLQIGRRVTRSPWLRADNG